MASHLELLPTEIQCSIYRLLDPISLISASQTCSRLRHIIKPTRTHLIERLLALECLPDVGGPSYVLHREGRPEPDWDNPGWTSMRFACSGCLRLLPHTSFNAQHILRLGYRKPMPQSTAAIAKPSWEPSLHGKHWGKRYWQKHGKREEEDRRTRRRYATAVIYRYSWHLKVRHDGTLRARLNTLQKSGIPEFQDMNFDKFSRLSQRQDHRMLEREIMSIEDGRCGFKRRLRKCLECRFRQGELKPHMNDGTPEVPIVQTRFVRFPSNLDRWFLGLSEVLKRNRPSFNNLSSPIHHYNARAGYWPLCMVRCSSCEHWQEMRAFRISGGLEKRAFVDGIGSQDEKGEEITDKYLHKLRCNRCFVKERGRVELGKILVKWLDELLLFELLQLQRTLYYWKPSSFRVRDMSGEHKREATKMDMMEKPNGKGLDEVWTREDVELVGLRYRRWEELLQMTQDEYALKGWGIIWEDTEDRTYYGWEAFWFWCKQCRENVEGKSNDLVDWVLGMDDANLVYNETDGLANAIQEW
ncbi:Fc.00g078700.m01.CDS01 [Cosmosporella sp. VM-42]